MMLCSVTGTLFATRKHARFEGHKLLVVREETLDGTPIGADFLAIDRANAGVGERVVVNKEGSSARLILQDEEIPVQAIIVAVVDEIEVRPA